jgi:TonB family protein
LARQHPMIKKLRYCFLLVLLLHLLFFLGFTVVLVDADENKPPEQDEESKAQRVLPSYVYQEQPPPAQQNTLETKPSLLKPVTADSAKNGILKPKAAIPKPPAAQSPPTMIGRPSKSESGAPHSDPANLVADKPTDKPLIKLLSRATGAKLFYPKSAQDFHITGMVRIQFYITPQGYVSQVVLLQSSGSSMLDDAGIYAISNISPVKGVDVYLKKPRTLSVGIIFG